MHPRASAFTGTVTQNGDPHVILITQTDGVCTGAV